MTAAERPSSIRPDEVADFRAGNPDIAVVDALIADHNGVLRGKKVPIGSLASLYASGMGLPGSLFATDISGATVEATGLGFAVGDADHLCLPVPARLHRVPWRSRPTAQVLMAMRGQDGAAFFADPRGLVERVTARLQADGLNPVVALELEFYLLDRERLPDGTPQPPTGAATGKRHHTNQVYGVDELDDFDDLLAEIQAHCKGMAIPVDSAISEYAPGQYEINMHHRADPVAACDDAILFKRVVRKVAEQHGLQATFMAKPFGDLAGSGLHLHLSMEDGAGTNVFAADDPAGSPMLRHAIAGLSATMDEGLALFLQNQNSYRRLRPNAYVPHAPSWAVNNRSCALRVPSGPPGSRRVEHRLAGADANPYIVMAAVLAGVHHGIRHRLDPGPPITGNAYQQLTPTLMASWAMALDRLDRSDFFAEAFGRAYLDVFLALKRGEREKFMAHVTPLEYQWYLDKV
ncbi:MAG: glutamine synthetase [Rhodospirillaceae bacterium]|nr:glutamine synthetase [Rhodospirillaceae bacterium]